MTHLDNGEEAGLAWAGHRGGGGPTTPPRPPRTRQGGSGLQGRGECESPKPQAVPTPPRHPPVHSARLLSKALPCPALPCGLARAQGQVSPAAGASRPAAEPAGAGGAGGGGGGTWGSRWGRSPVQEQGLAETRGL